MDIGIILIAYNRSSHTRKVLEGIKKEGINELSVFLDPPLSESDIKEQLKIKKYLKNILSNYKIREWEENIGLARSITSAVFETLKEKDAVIVLEDDCVPMKGFFDFIFHNLEFYKDQKEIGSVCGYLPSFIKSDKKEKKFFLANRFTPWGWGTWSDRWDKFSLDFRPTLRDIVRKNLDIMELGKDVYKYCKDSKFVDSKMEIWSLSWILAQFSNSMYTLYPSESRIKNIGFDGTGVHSCSTDVFDVDTPKKEIDKNLLLKESKENNINDLIDLKKQKEINSFLENNSKMMYLLNNHKK